MISKKVVSSARNASIAASPKKSQFQFLLPHLAFQLRNQRFRALPATPHVRTVASVRSCLQTLPSRPSSSPMHYAGFAQLCIAVFPHIQPLPPNAELLRHCTYAFPQPTPGAPLLALTPFHTPADSCSFVTSVSLFRELSPLSLSQFWGALHPSVPGFLARFPEDHCLRPGRESSAC